MIKLKLSFGDAAKPEQHFEIEEGELLSGAVERALIDVPLNGRPVFEAFQVVLNGNLIEKDFWALTRLKSEDAVIISPLIRSGDSGAIFKVAALIAITAAGQAYLAPLFASSFAAGLAVGAATLAGGLLLNALIPPAVQETDLGSSELDSSQMYSFSGQSNQVKKLGIVPRVYGTHRIYPLVAANAYTELQTSADGATQDSYLYAIYDFGMGPAQVADLRIGDTPLVPENFTDFSYRWVDLNKPAVSTGPWDDVLNSDFEYYRGDFEGTNLNIAMNNTGDEVIRNSADNASSYSNEIILNFTAPTGMFTFFGDGSRGTRSVDFIVEFSKVTEDVWKPWNDPTYVSSYSAVGDAGANYQFNVGMFRTGFSQMNSPYFYKQAQSSTYTNVFLNKGQNKILVLADSRLTVGQAIYFNSNYLGQIASIATYPSSSSARIITLDRNIVSYILVATFQFSSNGLNVTRIDQGGSAVSYIPVGSRFRISGNKPGTRFASVRFTPKENGQFKVRVKREAALPSGSYPNSQDNVTWSVIATRIGRPPIVTDKRHVFLELKIKANGQLSGNVSSLSGVTTGIVEVYDDATDSWSWSPSSNPAWVYTDLLIGQVNKRAIDKSRLHLPSISEWADFCEEIPASPPGRDYSTPRFTSDFILDYDTTLQGVVGQVTGSAQASLNIVDGKYGVLIDRLRTTPVQIFTPRNSSGFQSTRVYTPRPNGLKVKYIDPNVDWQIQEVVAYDNGFDFDNALELEDITAFACTDFDQAWRYGRYMLAQNRLRQETISILVDFEHLVCTRGDYVQVTQDVMRVGGTPARVKNVAGNVITIDDALEYNLALDYGYVFRTSGGAIYTSTMTPLTTTTFEANGDLPSVGDLIIVGEVGRVVYDCLVKSISPNEDLSANLILIEKADGVYAAESTGTLPDYDPQISATNGEFSAPNEVENLAVADLAWDCAGLGYEYYVDLIWDVPQASIWEYFAIYVDNGSGFTEIDQTEFTYYRYTVTVIGVEHKFKVLAVSATGRKLALGQVSSVTATPEAKTVPPADVEKLSTDITNEVLQLSWPPVGDCDVQEYILRYSVSTTGTWEASVPLLRAARNATSISTQARTGTYLIKAVDFAGNESLNASLAITTIPNLFNLNIIEEVEEEDFEGGLDRVLTDGDSAVLDTSGGAYYSEGYYYYKNILDLGSVYTVRLQSLIQAEGYSPGDLMSTWLTLDSVLLLASATYSEWDVEAQYRSSETLNVIADWLTLDSVEFLGASGDDFTEWRTFVMGDATGRVFQFRLKLISNRPTVSPRVFDAKIRADMPDRVDSYPNLAVDATNGYELTYPQAFKGPTPSPSVQISIEDADSGDYWRFDYKDLSGFLIRVYDKNDDPVSRIIDVQCKGYGREAANVI